jgi:hypothetical protein
VPRFVLIALGLLAAACSRQGSGQEVHAFRHHPPHGGTAVALGDDYNLELVLDRSAGRLDAYVFDDDMENFVRIAQPSFELAATAAGLKHDLILRAVANPATGETVGDTSLFTVRDEWLKTAPEFDAVLTKLDVHGNAFDHLAFNFPKGLDSD